MTLPPGLVHLLRNVTVGELIRALERTDFSYTVGLEAHTEYTGILIAERWSYLSTEQVTPFLAEL